MNASQALNAIREATVLARERLADPGIATRVERGHIQIVRVTYREDGASSVEPLSHWLCGFEVPAALAEMPHEGYLA